MMNSNCKSCICEPLFLFDATAGMIQSVWPCHEAIGMQQSTHNDVQFKLQAMYLWHIIFGALAGDMMHCRVYGHVTKQKICNKKKQVLHQCIKSNALLVILIISDNDNDWYDDSDPGDDDNDNNDNDDVDVVDNAVTMVALTHCRAMHSWRFWPNASKYQGAPSTRKISFSASFSSFRFHRTVLP